MQRLEGKLLAVHINGMKLCSSLPPERRTTAKVCALLTRHRSHHWANGGKVVSLFVMHPFPGARLSVRYRVLSFGGWGVK